MQSLSKSQLIQSYNKALSVIDSQRAQIESMGAFIESARLKALRSKVNSKTEFRKQLQQLINSESMENGSDTPDFLLAEFLCDVLDAWDRTVIAREKWYGREPKKVPAHECPQAPEGKYPLP